MERIESRLGVEVPVGGDEVEDIEGHENDRVIMAFKSLEVVVKHRAAVETLRANLLALSLFSSGEEGLEVKFLKAWPEAPDHSRASIGEFLDDIEYFCEPRL